MSKEREKFETWWMEKGQFDCAGGQDDHKNTIYEAFLAGWHEAVLEIASRSD